MDVKVRQALPPHARHEGLFLLRRHAPDEGKRTATGVLVGHVQPGFKAPEGLRREGADLLAAREDRTAHAEHAVLVGPHAPAQLVGQPLGHALEPFFHHGLVDALLPGPRRRGTEKPQQQQHQHRRHPA